MNADGFRRLVLRFDGAIEASHMGHPDFRVNGRIFATLQHDMLRGCVMLTPEGQRPFLSHPAFTPAAGAWGRAGSTLVRLSDVDEETLGEALTLAWRLRASAPAKASLRGRGGSATKRAAKKR